MDPLLDHVLATLAQTDMIGELGARRDDLTAAIRGRHWEAVRYYVREVRLDLVPDETDCLHVSGLALWRNQRLDEAKVCFEQARQYYLVVDKDPAHAALCYLELADIANERGQYQTASHYLETAQALLAEARQSNANVAARYDLIAAVVAPNVGRPRDAVAYGQRALHSFQIRGDKPAEFLALMAIASAAFQLGDYTEVSSRLDQAKLCYASGLVNRRYFARILNSEAHIEWYRGNLERATELAGELIDWANRQQETRQRVYACRTNRPDKDSRRCFHRPDGVAECDQVHGVGRSTIRRFGSIHISAAPGDGLAPAGVAEYGLTLDILQRLQSRRDVVSALFEECQRLSAT